MKTRLLFASSLILLATATHALSQGPLNPPGPPAPTMKSLDEIDAKLSQATAKLDDAATKAEKRTPISTLPFTIAASGSYYLTGNLTGSAGQDAITVNANNVAIDLNGFTLSGPGGVGIASAGSQRIRVRNGAIEGFTSGIRATASLVVVEDVQLNNNALDGINVGNGSIVQSCSVTNSGTNTNGRGIDAGTNAIISKCTVLGTSGSNARAIEIESGGIVVDCTARGNNAAGGSGIRVGGRSSIVRCDVSSNTGTGAGIDGGSDSRIIDCISSNNSGANNHGIRANDNVTISGCTVTANGGDGINVANRSQILNNLATGNLGEGIVITGNSNRVEGNHATGNATGGFEIDGSDNLIIRNSAGNNIGGEFAVAASNAVGPIVTQANVASNNSPHANFEFD